MNKRQSSGSLYVKVLSYDECQDMFRVSFIHNSGPETTGIISVSDFMRTLKLQDEAPEKLVGQEFTTSLH